MISSTWITEYREDRRALVTANAGYSAISVIGLLPNAPAGIWSDVSNALGALESPTKFLSHLFCELVGSGHAAIGERPLSLDGFLGSAHSRQDPWLLVPAMSLWISSPKEVERGADSLFRVVGLWEALLRSPLELHSGLVRPASDLGPFLPHARVPRQSIADAFQRAVRSRLEGQAF